jgi:hypothetical protein
VFIQHFQTKNRKLEEKLENLEMQTNATENGVSYKWMDWLFDWLIDDHTLFP